MLFAASESAVTKKPRLRLTMRRSSSLKACGFFQVAMSRDMLISCGIQWSAQVARYFSQAHLYLKGTSWLTSVLPLITRLSATLTRWRSTAAAAAARAAGAGGRDGAISRTGESAAPRVAVFETVWTSSSQTSMCVCTFLSRDYVSVACQHQALLDTDALMRAWAVARAHRVTRCRDDRK